MGMDSRVNRLSPIMTLSFFALLAIFFFAYDYHHILPKRPQSVHQWRQCDGGSFALCYARGDLNPFQPAVHNQFSDGGRTVAEFPVVYYLDGLLIAIFGNTDLIIRLVNLLLFYFGLFYLFRIGLLVTDKPMLALFPVAVVHSMPVMAFYASTSLPNIPAFALMIAGIYYCIAHFEFQKADAWWKAVFACSTAAMIKSPDLLPFLALVGVYACREIWKRKLIRGSSLLLIVVPLTLTIAWIAIARRYNAVYDGEVYFLMSIKPYWLLDKAFIDEISRRITTIWIYDYTYLPMLFLTGLAGILFTALPNKKARPYKAGLLLLLTGSVAYFYLFFEQFYHHDYYVIELYYLVAACSIAWIYLIRRIRFGTMGRWLSYALILMVVALNIRYTAGEMKERYTVDNTFNSYNDVYFDMTPKLRAAGIERTDKVIVVSDNSPNISLYLMDQLGYTRFPAGMDSTRMAELIRQDVKYIVCKPGDIDERPYLKAYLKELLIEHKTVQVYRAQTPKYQKNP